MNKAITAALARKRTALGEKQKGFTLIELLVVVLIIGVLAAIAIPIFLNQQEGAKDSAVAAQITQAKTSMSVEIAKGGTVAAAITAFPTLDSYTPSADITVTIAARGTTGFTITGFWKASGTTATVATHGYTITDQGAAVKMTT